MAENPDEDHSSSTNFKGFLNHDCTDEDEDLNPQEESRPIVSDASASSSAIDEANKKTDSSSSTGEKNKKKLSANAKPWNPDDFRRPDDETSTLLVTQPSQQNQWLNRFPWYHQQNQWQQVTRMIYGSPPLLSNPNNFRTLRMRWQLSPYAALWVPRSTSQSPMLYRAFILGQYRIYVPWRPFPMPTPMPIPMMYPMSNEDQQRMAIMMMLETTCRVGDVTMSLFRRELMRQRVPQLEPQTETQESDAGSSSQYGRDQEQPSENSMANQENLYQHQMANQENLYQQPMANQENLYQHPMANQEILYQHPMANQENLYQQQMANQENLYQHPMANQENLYPHPMANQENLYQHPMANQENQYQQPMDIMRMLETHCRLGDVTMPLVRRELIRQRVLQLEPQTEQPTETQEPDAESSSQYGPHQEQPK